MVDDKTPEDMCWQDPQAFRRRKNIKVTLLAKVTPSKKSSSPSPSQPKRIFEIGNGG